MKLLKICVEINFFQWNNIIYLQILETFMGFPIQVVLAEMTIQSVEKYIFAA